VGKRSTTENSPTLFDITPYQKDDRYHPDYLDDLIDEGEWYEKHGQYLEKSSPVVRANDERENSSQPEKSSPVERETVERENFFHWVEPYLARRRYQYFRYCCLDRGRSIDAVEKVHIPHTKKAAVLEAIAAGKSPDEIRKLL
jgi:hypothetical protein